MTTLATPAGTAPEVERITAAFERFVATGRPPGESERLAALRREAIERFAALGFPTMRLEPWRFTNVGPIARTPFVPAAETTVDTAAIADWTYSGAIRLAFVNGRFTPELSRLEGLPEGAWAGSLAQAIAEVPTLVEPHLARQATFAEHAFVALNTAFFHDGAFLHLPRGTVVEAPLHLLFVASPGEAPQAAYPRNLLVTGESCQVTILEDYRTLGSGTFLTCPVTEVVVGADSVIDHYKVEREGLDAFQVATLEVRQGRASAFSSHSISWGGAIVRNDVRAVLDGEGADANLNGLYLVEEEQLVDNHMLVEHARPHTTSHELYKGILEGRSRAVFSGLIHVHPGAQKTDAKQTNRNLLLSREALCNSQPQLLIYADDVKCTHGSTVGQLDETAVFYLRSRGIGEEAAKSLLTYAFASDILQRVRVPALRRDLEEFLFRRLPKGEIVREAF